jgi:hypothetical protein
MISLLNDWYSKTHTNPTGTELESGESGAVSSVLQKLKGVKLVGRSIYLDMQATTPVDPRVLDAMLPFYTEQFGNPHSRTHPYGWENEAAVETAREVRPGAFGDFGFVAAASARGESLLRSAGV